MKHTKGQWKYARHMCDNRIYAITNDKYHRTITICEVNDHPQRPDEFAANAKLIAAAPDLLKACSALTEALKMMREDSGITVGYNNFIEQGKQAIAKATQ